MPEGIFTHFAVSDEGESGEAFTHEQYARFWDAIEKLKARGVTFPLRHCSNSGAVLDYPEFHLDMVRPGIIVYGILPSQAIRHPLPLQPAMELKTIISLLKTVEPDTSISYGRCFHTRRQTRVATVPIGYADGYPGICMTRPICWYAENAHRLWDACAWISSCWTSPTSPKRRKA